jgi:hypothetical protein
MQSISLLLSEALTPYQVHVAPCAIDGTCLITVQSQAGAQILQRAFHHSQFDTNRSLTDVADGLLRDLRVAEGRLEPCMIAALKHATASAARVACGVR